jgi:hypothetical protein
MEQPGKNLFKISLQVNVNLISIFFLKWNQLQLKNMAILN